MKKTLIVLVLCAVLSCACLLAACGDTLSSSDSITDSDPWQHKESAGGSDATTTDSSCFRFQLLENGTYEVLARYHDMPDRVEIPSSYNGKAVTRVGAYFSGEVTRVYNRSVGEIVLPSSVKEIGEGAFFSYVSLSSVTLPSSIRVIGEAAFMNCVSLTSITIPDGIQAIESETFERCKGLTSITIPSSVTSIKSWSFSMCESLTSITFKGTKAQWNAIEKYGDSEESDGTWNRRTGNYTIHCEDGDIAKA